MTKGEPLREGRGCCKVVNTATMVMAKKRASAFAGLYSITLILLRIFHFCWLYQRK